MKLSDFLFGFALCAAFVAKNQYIHLLFRHYKGEETFVVQQIRISFLSAFFSLSPQDSKRNTNSHWHINYMLMRKLAEQSLRMMDLQPLFSLSSIQLHVLSLTLHNYFLLRYETICPFECIWAQIWRQYYRTYQSVSLRHHSNSGKSNYSFSSTIPRAEEARISMWFTRGKFEEIQIDLCTNTYYAPTYWYEIKSSHVNLSESIPTSHIILICTPSLRI